MELSLRKLFARNNRVHEQLPQPRLLGCDTPLLGDPRGCRQPGFSPHPWFSGALVLLDSTFQGPPGKVLRGICPLARTRSPAGPWSHSCSRGSQRCGAWWAERRLVPPRLRARRRWWPLWQAQSPRSGETSSRSAELAMTTGQEQVTPPSPLIALVPTFLHVTRRLMTV